ncbi:MAG: hypothetical protein RLZZ127_2072, partial [Planctomycetota bacterium]
IVAGRVWLSGWCDGDPAPTPLIVRDARTGARLPGPELPPPAPLWTWDLNRPPLDATAPLLLTHSGIWEGGPWRCLVVDRRDGRIQAHLQAPVNLHDCQVAAGRFLAMAIDPSATCASLVGVDLVDGKGWRLWLPQPGNNGVDGRWLADGSRPIAQGLVRPDGTLVAAVRTPIAVPIDRDVVVAAGETWIRLDPESGAIRWRRPAPPGHRPDASVTPILTAGRLVLGVNGHVQVLDPGTGRDLGTIPTGMRPLVEALPDGLLIATDTALVRWRFTDRGVDDPADRLARARSAAAAGRIDLAVSGLTGISNLPGLDATTAREAGLLIGQLGRAGAADLAGPAWTELLGMDGALAGGSATWAWPSRMRPEAHPAGGLWDLDMQVLAGSMERARWLRAWRDLAHGTAGSPDEANTLLRLIPSELVDPELRARWQVLQGPPAPGATTPFTLTVLP